MPRLPYTNFHDLNLNWFLKEFKKIIESVTKKQDAPAQPGTAGQVLGLNDGLQPVWIDQEGGSHGTTDYTELENKPQINGITLAGNKTGSEYGVINTPATPGAAGQVLGLDASLTPKWIDQEGGSFDFDITGTASGAIASFDDGANNEPLQDLQIAIEPVQAGTGNPSLTNIRPISGWTGANVYRTGKNLLSKSFEHYSNVSTNLSDYFWIKAGTYILSFDSSTATFWRYIARLKDRNGNVLSDNAHNPSSNLTYKSTLYGYTNGGNTTEKSIILNIVEDCYARFLFWNTTNGASDSFSDVQLELGSSISAYTPYIEQTYPITWQTEAGTVYGGTVNPVTGKLIVDRASVVYDGIDENWSLQSINDYGIANFSIPQNHYPASNLNSLCNMLTPQTSGIAQTTTEGYFIHQNGSTIYIRLDSSRANTVEAFKTWLATNNIQIVYTLPEPIVYDLSPTEIRTLLGTNNVWADTGDILQCVYKVDPDIYLRNVSKVKILTPAENTLILKPFPTTYNFGERTTLTLTATADTYYKFMFKCPANAATNITINGANDTAGDIPAAGKTYIVEIWAGIANYKELVLTVG